MDEDIKKLLKKWINHEKKIKNYEKNILDLKQKQSIINPYLEKYMEINKLEKIYVNKDCSMYNKQFCKFNEIDEKYLNKTLSKIIEEREKKDKIVKYIMENRNVTNENKFIIEE